MKNYTPATRVRENVVIGSMETRMATGQTVYILAAMDEYADFVIAFEILFVNSTATWAAFIRQKVLTNKMIAEHPEQITFFLAIEPENVALTAEDLPNKHKWVADDGRCFDVLQEFFDGLIGSMSGGKK